MHKSKFIEGALELGIAQTGTSDILLAGAKALLDYKPDGLEEHIDPEELSLDDLHFVSLIGLDYRCYYFMQEFYRFDRRVFERGVGHVELRDGKHFFVRDMALSFGTSEGHTFAADANHKPMNVGEGEYIMLASMVPPTYLEALAAPYSIIASTTPMSATPVELEPESVLGRKDNVIQSIDMNELRDMFLTKPRKQIKAGTSRLELTRKGAVMTAPVLRPAPIYTDHEKPPAQQGYIIYNKESKRLEFFNGEEWIALAQEAS
jgi:hypothetical protein